LVRKALDEEVVERTHRVRWLVKSIGTEFFVPNASRPEARGISVARKPIMGDRIRSGSERNALTLTAIGLDASGPEVCGRHWQ